MIEQEQKNSALKSAAVFTTLAAASFGMAGKAEAVLMNPGIPGLFPPTPDQSYLNKGLEFQGVALALRQNDPSGPAGFASATVIDPYTVATSGHLTKAQLALGYTFSVSTSANYNTATEWFTATDVIVHPLYDGTRNTPDITILKFSSPIPGVSTATIGIASPGEIVSAAGYGFSQYPGPAVNFRDGNVRGWEARVRSAQPIDSSAVYYQSTLFSSFDGIPLVGKGLNGDSGGPTINGLGQVVGLSTAQSGNGSTAGTTTYLNLSHPDVYNFIQANRVIPEPSGLALIAAAGFGLMSRQRRS